MASRGQTQVTRWGALGELELAILADLWAHGAADAKSVHARLGAARNITPNTVQSAMKRLHEKSLLERDKVSHAYVYGPSVDREDFHKTLVEDAIAPVVADGASSMVAAFVDLAERAGEDTLAELEALVAARRRERSGA